MLIRLDCRDEAAFQKSQKAKRSWTGSNDDRRKATTVDFPVFGGAKYEIVFEACNSRMLSLDHMRGQTN